MVEETNEIDRAQVYEALHEQHAGDTQKRQYSADRMLEILMKRLPLRNGVDVGCGIGFFVQAMHSAGMNAIGIEGDWVQDDALLVDRKLIKTKDLEKRFKLGERYDLAVCLEVAEHLEPKRAGTFVADLCQCSDVVLFSAAMQGQGGTGHKNEQWQDYWAREFLKQGYLTCDVVRPLIKGDAQIMPWFRQNVLCFVNAESPHIYDLRDSIIPIPAARHIDHHYHDRIVTTTRRAARRRK